MREFIDLLLWFPLLIKWQLYRGEKEAVKLL